MTQVELGGSHLSPRYVSMIEHDRVRPSLAMLRVLADRLGQPLSSFLDAELLPGEEAGALLTRGESLLRQHRFPEALETFQSAAEATARSGDPRLGVRLMLGEGQALAGLRRFGDAAGHLAGAQ